MDTDVRIPATVIVCVSAESNHTGNVGSLVIQKHHETSFSVLFCALGEMEMTDIDCVSVDVKEKRVSFFDPSSQPPQSILSATPSSIVHTSSYCITDRSHLYLFVEAQAECQRVCNLYLELKSRFADVYHGAVYCELGVLYQPGSQSHNGSIPDELARLQVQSLRKLDSDIQHMERHPAHQSTNNTTVVAAQSSSLSARCFYCSASHTDSELFNHPYVPLAFDKQRIFMCTTCLGNWKDYRDAAQQENQLILAGEINEEICALCSDTPETLVLCQRCPRSYCAACLSHVLGDTAATRILRSDTDATWRCMSCANRVSAQPLLSRDVWVSWRRLQTQTSTQSSVRAAVTTDMTQSSNHNYYPNKTHMTTNSGGSVDSFKGNDHYHIGGSVTTTTTGTGASRPKRQRDNSDTSERGRSSTKSNKPVTNGQRRTGSSSNAVGSAPSSAKKAKLSHPTVKEFVATSADGSNGTALTTTADELFYFGQYLDFLEQECTAAVVRVQQKQQQQQQQQQSDGNLQNIKSNARPHKISSSQSKGVQEDYDMEETDDTCFLCKDGGEVIECDFRMKHGSTRLKATATATPCHCRKVYHSYCLNYVVPASVKTWLCPRHYCDVCGQSEALQIFCCFCPLSLCRRCAPRYPTVCHKSGDFYSLPQLVASSATSETSVEMIQAVRERLVPYSNASIELVACDNCADFCLRLQQSAAVISVNNGTVNRDSNREKRSYFYTKIGAKRSFLDMQAESELKNNNDDVSNPADIMHKSEKSERESETLSGVSVIESTPETDHITQAEEVKCVLADTVIPPVHSNDQATSKFENGKLYDSNCNADTFDPQVLCVTEDESSRSPSRILLDTA